MSYYKPGVISINRKTKRRLDYYRKKVSLEDDNYSWNDFLLEVLVLIRKEVDSQNENPENMLDKTSSVY